MADSELVSMTGDPTPVDSDIFYGTDSGGTVDKKFNFGDTATFVESGLDVIAAGVRTAPDTGTPGQVSIDVTLSGGIAGGDTLTGGTGAGDDLTLASTAHATRGTIFVRDPVQLLSEDKTHTGTTGYAGITSANTVTLQDTAGGLRSGNLYYGIKLSPTLVFEEDGAVLFANAGVESSYTILNASTETRTVPGAYGVVAAPIYKGQGAGGSLTVTTSGSYRDYVLVSRVGGAGPTCTVTAHATVVSDLVVEPGGTVTTRRGILFNNAANTGTLTTQVGVDVAALTAATTNIGIRNASTTVNTPIANANITAVSATIRHDASTVTLTADASYTLTSAPTISDGQNGERLLVINVDTADTITLQDQGTLASSNLRLSATTIALGPRDSIELVYSSTVGDWVQVGQVNVV